MKFMVHETNVVRLLFKSYNSVPMKFIVHETAEVGIANFFFLGPLIANMLFFRSAK
jgi:hypothetical protein